MRASWWLYVIPGFIGLEGTIQHLVMFWLGIKIFWSGLVHNILLNSNLFDEDQKATVKKKK